jgi:RimJ/RimL family protein N-acetyltransferase
MRLENGMLQGRNIRLRLAEVSDAAFIFALRSDEERNRYLSAIGAEVSAQAEWLAKYKEREKAGTEYYFIIEDRAGAPCGTVRIYDYRGDSFSWGSWVIAPGGPPTAAIETALLIYEFAFGALGFQRCHFEVRKGNDRVQAFHERFGARMTHEDEHTRYFDYSRVGYEAIRGRYAKYLP